MIGTPFACTSDPSITPEFLADQAAEDNRVVGNVLIGNGTNPSGPFAPVAADLTLLTGPDAGNCFEDNVFSTFFPPGMPPPPCE